MPVRGSQFPGGQSLVIAAALAFFVIVIGYRFSGVLQDTALALNYRFSLDYGEGIVWQQTLLMFGPRMYSPSPDLPFIVFHYPPLFHTVVRALMALGWDPLFSGRLVSVTASAVSAFLIGTMIMLGTRSPRTVSTIVIAVTMAALFLCLNPVRTWGVWMRVDMLAIALGLTGTIVLIRSRCSLVGTTIALLLCVASVFTKQTQIPAGISVFAVALICAPRTTILAAAVAGSIGITCAAMLEWVTGGFFKNIIAYNINPLSIGDALHKIWLERELAPIVFLMVVALAQIGLSTIRETGWAGLRSRDRLAITETVLLIHFPLAALSALQILKDRSSNNYFIDFLAIGCVLIGIALCRSPMKTLVIAVTLLALSTANLRPRFFLPEKLTQVLRSNESLVRRIAAADRPVISDDMVLVLRAGKSLIYEPAIVRVLVAQGKWDPTPLLMMLHDHGLAFALTYTSGGESGPLVMKTIENAYPVIEDFPANLTGHYPPQK